MRHTAIAIIQALADTGYEIVKKEPDAPEITEAMIEAARRKYSEVNLRGSSGGDWSVDPMRAAIDAAMKARG